jgi:prefoldin subunit 5
MNANLRGNVMVKGMTIESFIKMHASNSMPQTSNTEEVSKKIDIDNIDDIVAKKMQPLDAFQDEKKILSDALASLMERVTKLEATVTEATVTEATVTEAAAPSGPPPVDLKPDIDVLFASIEKLEKKVTDMKPRRGVDQATLDNTIAEFDKNMNSKIEEVSAALGQLRNELED